MNTRTEKQQKTIERLLIAAILTVILCGLITPLVITYYIFPAQLEKLIDPPAKTAEANVLPDDLKDWTPEQLEDEAATYRDSIEVITDEQHRRERTGHYMQEEWETVPEPSTL